MNRKDAMTKAWEMLAEAERDGISTYDTVTVVFDNGEYAIADNGDAAAGMNEYEAHAALTNDLMDHD